MQVFKCVSNQERAANNNTDKNHHQIKTKPNDRRSQLPPKTGQGGSSCIRMRTTHNNKIVMKFYVGDLTSFPDCTGMVRGTLPWFLLVFSTPKFARGASIAFSLPPITASGCFTPSPAPGPTTCKADFSTLFSIPGFSFSLLSRCIWKLAIAISSFSKRYILNANAFFFVSKGADLSLLSAFLLFSASL